MKRQFKFFHARQFSMSPEVVSKYSEEYGTYGFHCCWYSFRTQSYGITTYSTPSPDVTCVGINRKFCGRDFLEPASRIRRECHIAEAQQPTQKTYRESAWIKCWLDKMPWDWNRVWAKVFTINQLLCVALKLSFLIHSDIVVITTMKTTFLFHLLLCLFATATAKSDGVSGDAKPHASLIWCYYLFW